MANDGAAAGKAQKVDVVVAGGGQAGLALALALRVHAPALSVTVIDATVPTTRPREGRASTIAPGGQRLLERLGVWSEIASHAQPVTAMVITDSRVRDVYRPVYLTFAKDDGAAQAHVVPDGVVVAALSARAETEGVQIRAPDSVSDFTADEQGVVVTTGKGERIAARLLVAADGVRSRLREFAGIGTYGHDYGQSGIVVTLAHEKPHGGNAEEHFMPGGPFATLPLKAGADGRDRTSLVWTEPTETAERLVAADPMVFRTELARRFGHRFGAFEVLDKPRAFPLALRLARQFVRPRFALVGDAAHSIHPIAGQGLNLGYRDVAALAEVIVDAHRLGLDIGSETVLDGYQRWRRYDTAEMALMTDVLTRLFSNDNPVLRIARDVGLGVVDRLPELKNIFMREAAGERGVLGQPPKLLTGEAL